MPTDPRDSYARARDRVERQRAAVARKVSKIGSELREAIAKRRAEYERRAAMFTRRSTKPLSALDAELERARKQLDKSLSSVWLRGDSTRLGETTAWVTVSEWLVLFKRAKGRRITKRNRSTVEEMIVQLGQVPEALEAASDEALASLIYQLQYFRGDRASEIATVRKQIFAVRDKRRSSSPPTKRAAPPRQALSGDSILIPKLVYQVLEPDFTTIDPDNIEPGRLAWMRALDGATRSGRRYTVVLPPRRVVHQAALNELEGLKERWCVREGQGMSLRATQRVIEEIRAVGLVDDVAAKPLRRGGRVPGIRWRSGGWTDPNGDRVWEAVGVVPRTGIEFTAIVRRRKGRPIQEQEVALVVTQNGAEVEDVPREHRTMPQAKRVAREWLKTWWCK